MTEGSVADGYKLDKDSSIVRIREAEDSEQQTGEDITDDNVIAPAADLGSSSPKDTTPSGRNIQYGMRVDECTIAS